MQILNKNTLLVSNTLDKKYLTCNKIIIMRSSEVFLFIGHTKEKANYASLTRKMEASG
jgi:hypothetical protein